MRSLVLATVLAIGPVLPALADAAAIPIEDVKRGQSVVLMGTVDRITDEDAFVLRDATGTIKVDLGGDMVMVDERESVRVEGFVDRDLFKEVYARTIVREDGTETEVDRRW